MTKNNINIEKTKNNLPVGIRQQANGTFSCRINVKDEHGEWKNKERSGFRTIKEAQAARTLLQAEYIKDPALINKKVSNITMSELYQEFISKQATFDCEKSTLKRYDSLQRNHVEPKWGKRQIKAIKPQEITDYLFELTQTLSYAYIMSLHKYIKVLFKFAISREYMCENPVDKVVTPKEGVEEGAIKTYTHAELDTFEQRFASTNLLPAFKLGRALGIRIGETFGLLWSDVNWDKHTIKIRKQLVYEDSMWCLRSPKTKCSIREIELQDDIYNYLKELKILQEQQKVEMGVAYRETRVSIDRRRNIEKEIVDNLDFINIKTTGELLTPDSAKILGRIAREELGYNFKFHNLRHTHASWLAANNIPVVVVKTRLGHSKIETTLRYYTHVTDDMRKNLMNTLNSTNDSKGGINIQNEYNTPVKRAEQSRSGSKEFAGVITLFERNHNRYDIIRHLKGYSANPYTVDKILSNKEVMEDPEINLAVINYVENVQRSYQRDKQLAESNPVAKYREQDLQSAKDFTGPFSEYAKAKEVLNRHKIEVEFN